MRVLPRVFLAGFFCLLVGGCTTYRLQYVENFFPDEATQAEAEGTDSQPYRYLYEESYDQPFWFPWSCGLTFWAYGGSCWLYFFTYESDRDDVRDKGHAKLESLLGRKPLLVSSGVRNLRSVNRLYPPRIRIFDPDERTLVQGEAAAIQTWSDTGKGEKTKPLIAPAVKSDIYDFNFSFESLQFAVHNGLASVQSHVKEDGVESEVAAGEVPYQGIELKTYILPKNGLFWSWVPYAVTQNLEIKDFSSNLRLFQSPGSTDIPVVISNPKDGTIITNYVNSYRVGLNTIGILLGGGWSRHWKLKNETNFWSISASAWVSTIDYTKTSVRFSSREAHKSYFAALQSYQGNLDAYYNILPWKVAIGFHAMNRIFPRVRMPDDMEFRGPPRYDESRNIFVRPRLNIDTLEFGTRTYGFSLSYIFEELKFDEK